MKRMVLVLMPSKKTMRPIDLMPPMLPVELRAELPLLVLPLLSTLLRPPRSIVEAHRTMLLPLLRTPHMPL